MNRMMSGGAIECLLTATLVLAIGFVAAGIESAVAKTKNPVVVMETSKGAITIELDAEKAPGTVKNFLWYVDNGFYDGLVFHRVIENFMIQGGGFTKDLVKKQPNPPIKNEADNGLKNDRGTIAMARIPEVHSATCQFYINLKDNNALNFREPTPRGYGYAVFGKVVDGMEVVDEIALVKTARKSGMDDVPVTPIVIKKAYQKEVKASKKEPKEKSEEAPKGE